MRPILTAWRRTRLLLILGSVASILGCTVGRIETVPGPSAEESRDLLVPLLNRLPALEKVLASSRLVAHTCDEAKDFAEWVYLVPEDVPRVLAEEEGTWVCPRYDYPHQHKRLKTMRAELNHALSGKGISVKEVLYFEVRSFHVGGGEYCVWDIWTSAGRFLAITLIRRVEN